MRRLRNCDLTAGDLAAGFNTSKQTRSHHFAILKAAGPVSTRREAQTIWYSLNTRVLQEVLTIALVLLPGVNLMTLWLGLGHNIAIGSWLQGGISVLLPLMGSVFGALAPELLDGGAHTVDPGQPPGLAPNSPPGRLEPGARGVPLVCY